MNCAEAREEIVAVLYGELDGVTAKALEQHVEACEGCRGQLELQRRTMRALDRWTLPELSSDLRPPVPTAASAPLGTSRRQNRWIRSLFLGVAAGLLVFAALALLNARIRVADGKLTVSLRVPGTAEEMGTDAVTPALALLEEDIRQLHHRLEWSHVTLARAIQLGREQDASVYGTALQDFARGMAEDVIRTRRELESALLWTASNPPQPVDEDH